MFIPVGECCSRRVRGVKSRLLITGCRIHYSSARNYYNMGTITLFSGMENMVEFHETLEKSWEQISGYFPYGFEGSKCLDIPVPGRMNCLCF